MSIKCRSCGYINPDNKTVCDNCGCNLKYSKIFEKLLENEKHTSDFLFELESSKQTSINDESEFLCETSEELPIEQNTTENEVDEYKPITFPTPEEKKSKITRQVEDNEKNIRLIGEIISIEFSEFFIFFLLLLFLTKGIFREYSIAAIEIGKSTLIAYVFFNIHSYILTGKRLSSHLIKKTREN